MAFQDYLNKVKSFKDRIKSRFLVSNKTSLILGSVGLTVSLIAITAGVALTLKPKNLVGSKAAGTVNSAVISKYRLTSQEVNKLESQVKAIQAKKPSWKSGVTDMAVNVMRDPKYFKGLPSPKPEQKQKLKNISKESNKKLSSLSVTSYPTSFDWRNRHGYNYMTPVKDQGSCGSCWDFAGVASIEPTFKAYYNRPDLNIDLSEKDVLWCGMFSSGCDGGLPWDVFYYAQEKGIVTETCRPYECLTTGCDTQCLSGAARCPRGSFSDNLYKISRFEGANSGSPDNLKRIIMSYGPVTAVMDVYADFFFYKGGIYSRDPTSFHMGGHAISLLGWGTEDGVEYFIGKNSWGTNWGENGYFRYKLSEFPLWFWRDYGLLYAVNPIPPRPITPNCVDADSDGYCVWGLGPKPGSGCPSCSSEYQDCDDSKSQVTTACWGVTPIPTPTSTPTVKPTLTPTPTSNPGSTTTPKPHKDPADYPSRPCSDLRTEVQKSPIEESNWSQHISIDQPILSTQIWIQGVDSGGNWYHEGQKFRIIHPNGKKVDSEYAPGQLSIMINQYYFGRTFITAYLPNDCYATDAYVDH